MRKVLAAVLLASVLTLGACLQKETTHTLYLEPGGAVAWTISEKDVRSDERNPAARLKEENDYLASVSAGTHDTGRALAALGGISPDVRLVRATRPFMVVTEARFAAVDHVIEQMLSELHVPGAATLEHTNGMTRLLIHADVTSALENNQGDATPVGGLLAGPDRFRLVLTEGRFVDANGFTLSDDGAVAVPIEISDDDLARTEGLIDLSLTWEAR
jgi:hypothetical protein